MGLGQLHRRCLGGWHAAPAASAAATVAGATRRWRGDAAATAVASLQDACLQYAVQLFPACPSQGKVFHQRFDANSLGPMYQRHNMSPTW